MDFTKMKMVQNRVLCRIDDSATTTATGIITTIRTIRDAIKVAEVLAVDNTDILKGKLKAGDKILIDQYDSVVKPWGEDSMVRILEWYEILGVIDSEN